LQSPKEQKQQSWECGCFSWLWKMVKDSNMKLQSANKWCPYGFWRIWSGEQAFVSISSSLMWEKSNWVPHLSSLFPGRQKPSEEGSNEKHVGKCPCLWQTFPWGLLLFACSLRETRNPRVVSSPETPNQVKFLLI
jgi:hypothetical protein